MPDIAALRTVAVNVPPGVAEAITKAQGFEESCEVFYVFIPIHRSVLAESEFDMMPELLGDIRRSLEEQITAYQERLA